MIIDLSRTIENVLGEPDLVSIEELSHKDGAMVLGEQFGLTFKDFPNGLAVNTERISLTTHTGTHMDSPYHYGPISEDAPAKKIEDIPLEWCVNKGILIDLSNEKNEEPINKREIENYLMENKISIDPLNIILINTGADHNWGKEEYFTHFRGISEEATIYLLNFGVKIIGIDSFGFDPPFDKMLKKYSEKKDKSFLWPAHMLGRKKEYCQIERLTNLSNLPKNKDFQVICAPIKISGVGAAWCRTLALVKED